ncbi:unnamed protein product [Calypogeia fissa]
MEPRTMEASVNKDRLEVSGHESGSHNLSIVSPSHRLHEQRARAEELDLERAEKSAQRIALHKYISSQQKNVQFTPDRQSDFSVMTFRTDASSVPEKSRLGTLILEQDWFSVYKRLYVASLLLNIIGLVLATTGYFPYASTRAALFCLGNILMVVLVRSEVILRIVYWLAVRLLGYPWVPLRLKTMTTSLLQSLGGIHSGCGLGAIMWLVYSLVLDFQYRHIASIQIVGVGLGILVLLVLSALAAFPILRHLHHNLFERVHRFAGWSAVGMVWVYVVLSSFWNPVTQSYHVSTKSLVQSESLWFTVATTMMIIFPWLFVRKVPVETLVAPGKLNSLLLFEGGVKPGLLKRISPSPLSEWHAFGIISDGQTRHSILAGAVGDFTSSLMKNPPTHIWVRNFHFAGLPYLVNLYDRVLLLATGSGIGVYLSFLLQETRTDMHTIWITKRVPQTFGEVLWEVVKNIPSEKLTIIDTAVSGRPNPLQLVLDKAKEWRPDMVAVTSNPKGTAQIVSGCKAVGIPAFGPIWDS